MERVAAATGKIAFAETRFDNLCGFKGGGVLLALPALPANGLLKFSERFFRLPGGYYSLYSIFPLQGFMAPSRVKSIGQLRYTEPGEWGKILRLDRIPDARTLREKIGLLSEEEKAVCEWSGALSDDWMKADRAVELLCDRLNETETIYPGTTFRLKFELVSYLSPPIQEF